MAGEFQNIGLVCVVFASLVCLVSLFFFDFFRVSDVIFSFGLLVSSCFCYMGGASSSRHGRPVGTT